MQAEDLSITDRTMTVPTYDFRSDTFTTPLPEMIEAIQSCSWGDAVFSEDKTTCELEAKVAALAGKEDGVFMMSGTLSNQIGIRINLFQPPYSLICDSRAHVYSKEAAGLAILSQAMVVPVIPKNGRYLTLEEIKESVILPDQHHAETKLISLENTICGTVFPLEEIKRISEWAREHDIRMHLDGARLWNASAATGIALSEWCQYFDTISLCLSKSLCAPIGSVLVGSKQQMKKARHLRKQQGGGVRQSGWLAAAGLIAVDKVFPQLARVQLKAKQLAERLEAQGIVLDQPADSNFVVFDAKKSNIDLKKFGELAPENGIKVWGNRLVLHYYTTDDAIERLYKTLIEAKAAGTPTAQSSNN